jgi:hypothetical protein
VKNGWKNLNWINSGLIMKTLKNIIFVTLPSLFIVLLLLEVFFRTIIPASQVPMNVFDGKDKMWISSNKNNTGVHTIGKFAEIRSKWKINNMRWNYPIDYYPNSKKKLIAVIGDSFIEALQVNIGDNYPYLLNKMLADNYEVYAFGKGGVPLSQYLNMSRYVNKYFKADILIVNIVHNDFDESIQELWPQYQYLQLYFDKNDSIQESIPQNINSARNINPIKRMLYRSALIRYLFYNIKIREFLKLKNTNLEANINTEVTLKNMSLINRATKYLVKTIKAENNDKRIIFIMDAPRDAIYENAIEKSNVLWMNKMMDTICSDNKVEFIDLTMVMNEDYKKNHIKFNSNIDGHWNEYGHKFVANILYEYLKNNKQ